MDINRVPSYKFLWELNLPKEVAMDLYKDLRAVFQKSHPDKFIEASDAYGLTILPLNYMELENYKVENYEVGVYNNMPTLYKVENPQKLLILKNNALESVEL
jgi:hypothetical protein